MTVEHIAGISQMCQGHHVSCVDSTEMTYLDKRSEPLKCCWVEKKIYTFSDLGEKKKRVAEIAVI